MKDANGTSHPATTDFLVSRTVLERHHHQHWDDRSAGKQSRWCFSLWRENIKIKSSPGSIKGWPLPMFSGREDMPNPPFQIGVSRNFWKSHTENACFFLLVFPYWKKVVVGRIKFLLKITSLLSGLPIVFDDGEWVNFRLFFGVLLLFMLRDITLYKTCRKNKIGSLKVQITNVLMKIMRNGGRDASIGVVEQKRVKMVEDWT